MLTSDRVEYALVFAAMKHEGQVRKGSDVPYITHPVAVAQELAEMHLDAEAICAAILHDDAMRAACKFNAQLLDYVRPHVKPGIATEEIDTLFELAREGEVSEGVQDSATMFDKIKAQQARRVLDCGTGSGALLLAVLAELPQGLGVGIDRCEQALEVARDEGGLLLSGTVREEGDVAPLLPE